MSSKKPKIATGKAHLKSVKPTASQIYLMALLGVNTLSSDMLEVARRFRNKNNLRRAAFEQLLKQITLHPVPSFVAALDASPLMPLPAKHPKGEWGELRYIFKTEVAQGMHPRNNSMVPEENKLAWFILVKHFKVPNDAQLRWVKPYHDALRKLC